MTGLHLPLSHRRASTTASPSRPGARLRSLRGKRAADLVGAALLLAIVAPLFALIAGVVLVTQGRPVFFRQRRIGLGGAHFTMLKFRSMRHDVDGAGIASDHMRVTKVGQFLRATSLDELPNLVNVLRGDMSIIGPRPQLEGLIRNHSDDRHLRRHDVRPGISGLAQVNGRNDLDFRSRFEFDVEYVDACSMRLDAAILVRTLPAVLSRRGSSACTAAPAAASRRAASTASVAVPEAEHRRRPVVI
ncbi:sugar transferase [Curtobacterium sp. VKM Ac-2922]|uniref:sugar transferase n=1 Tax=Curtobacterium sp. VKM Ac-2922 TaxID=2929475 RepID=UPI001FB35CD6|nr:sugar transferase [Curtobacterium sp. VKM Ac-2922]MCJ1714078.1 sugar transferase [Curtobacterium sp. VKM Ac-2922]